MNIIPFHLRKIISEGIFVDVLSYCLPLFGGCDKGEIETLQVMQNKAARLVTHLPFRTPRKEIFDKLGWLTVSLLIFYHSALTTFRIRQSKEPRYLSRFLNRNSKSGRIVISNTSLTLAKKSYCYPGSAQWNTLPENFRNTAKVGQFKTQLRRWILKHVPQFTGN